MQIRNSSGLNTLSYFTTLYIAIFLRSHAPWYLNSANSIHRGTGWEMGWSRGRRGAADGRRTSSSNFFGVDIVSPRPLARSLARALLPPPAACDSQVRLVVRPRNDLNFGERLKNNVVCAISSLMDICLQNRQIIIDQCPINICVKGANSY